MFRAEMEERDRRSGYGKVERTENKTEETENFTSPRTRRNGRKNKMNRIRLIWFFSPLFQPSAFSPLIFLFSSAPFEFQPENEWILALWFDDSVQFNELPRRNDGKWRGDKSEVENKSSVSISVDWDGFQLQTKRFLKNFRTKRFLTRLII